VAFKTSMGEIVIIVLNNSNSEKSFNIITDENKVNTVLPAGAVGTYFWQISG
jgi:glucosylceramidase